MLTAHLRARLAPISSTVLKGYVLTVAAMVLGPLAQAADSSDGGPYCLPDDPSWTKRPSGKHRVTHLYDLSSFKNAIIKEGVRPWEQATVGVAISRNGHYGTAVVRSAPYSRCHGSVGRQACTLTAAKGTTVRRFAFSGEWPSDIVIEDVPGFVAFVDGPERFTISYIEDKGKGVTLKF